MSRYTRKLPHFLGLQNRQRIPGRTGARFPHGQARIHARWDLKVLRVMRRETVECTDPWICFLGYR